VRSPPPTHLQRTAQTGVQVKVPTCAFLLPCETSRDRPGGRYPKATELNRQHRGRLIGATAAKSKTPSSFLPGALLDRHQTNWITSCAGRGAGPDRYPGSPTHRYPYRRSRRDR
jgi:hypothetical protein